MDDLHLSDFREMRLKSKGDYEIANSAVVSISFNDYLKKFIFSGQGFGCANFKADKSYISHLRNFIALTVKYKSCFFVVWHVIRVFPDH